MKLAPLIVFAFNRPDTLQNTLSSLRRNDLAKDTELFVFVDGPRNDSDVEKIERVRVSWRRDTKMKSLVWNR